MEPILQAICLLQEKPMQATKLLNTLYRTQSSFLQNLQQTAQQLPQLLSSQTFQQRERLCKLTLTLLNRFTLSAFSDQGNDIYQHIYGLHSMMLQVLQSKKLALNAKKAIVPSLTKIVAAINLDANSFMGWVEKVIGQDNGGVLFIYLQTIWEGGASDVLKMQILCHSYKHVYYGARQQLKKLVDYYRSTLMQGESGWPNGPAFAQILNQNSYIAQILYRIVEFLCQQRHRPQVSDMLLEADLAEHISQVLRIQEQMLGLGANGYGLKFMVVCNLKEPAKTILNQLKSKSLSTVRIILQITDKQFNLRFTNKPLMRGLFQLAQLLVSDLLICSRPSIFAQISLEMEMTRIIAAMFGLLSEVVLFKDLRQMFEGMSIDQLVRLTLSYLAPTQEQTKLFQSQHQQYFALMFLTTQGKFQDGEEPLPQQFSVRKDVCSFMKSMSNCLQGFNSIIVDVYCDWLWLQIEHRKSMKPFNRQSFIKKYNLKDELLDGLCLESVLLGLLLMFQNGWQHQVQKWHRTRRVLAAMQTALLSQRQLFILFMLLAHQAKFFQLPQIHTEYYYFVEKAVISCRQARLEHSATYFIRQLLKQSYNTGFFIQQILQQIVAFLPTTQSLELVRVLIFALKSRQIIDKSINLYWINRCLQLLSIRITQLSTQGTQHYHLIDVLMQLWLQLLNIGNQLVDNYKDCPYPSFQESHQQFIILSPALLTNHLLEFCNNIYKQQNSDKQDQSLLSYLGEICFTLMLPINTPPTQAKHMLIATTILMLRNYQQSQEKLQKTLFKMVYQLINYYIYDLSDDDAKVIIGWLKHTYYHSEYELNRVCLITQLIISLANPYSALPPLLIQIEPLFQTLQKQLLIHMISHEQMLQAINQQSDADRKKLKSLEIDIKIKQQQRNPITTMRLFNTFLMNPFLNTQNLSRFTSLMRQHVYRKMPIQDLAAQVAALRCILRQPRLSTLKCLNFTIQLLSYNSKHSQPLKYEEQHQIQISIMASQVYSTLVKLDPYSVMAEVIQEALRDDRKIAFQQGQVMISVGEYLRADKHLMQLATKMCNIRTVKDKPRKILRIKRQ